MNTLLILSLALDIKSTLFLLSAILLQCLKHFKWHEINIITRVSSPGLPTPSLGRDVRIVTE